MNEQMDERGCNVETSWLLRDCDGLRNVAMSFSSILDSFPVPAAVYVTSLEVVACNAKASSILGVHNRLDESLGSSVTSLSAAQWADHLTSVLRTGQPVRLCGMGFRTDRGGRFFDVSLAVLRGEDGVVVAGMAVLEDVTESLRVSRELEIAERSAGLGKLVSKVAHELNGPLDGVLRYISLAGRQIDQGQPEKAVECLQRCREGLLRMAQIVGDLLEYSRGMPIPLVACGLDQLVQEAIRTAEARRMGPGSIEVRQSYGRGIPLIRRGNLFQVFCNLVKNAYDAMPEGGRLEIEGSVAEGQVLVMVFRDSGPGFAEQAMEMLFEPFFTTKEHGTGLGLAVCKDIVQRYKGMIDARNGAEGGAIVTLRLPLAEIV